VSDSLYSPPRGSYDDARPSGPPARLGREVDLGAALSYPFQTNDWWMTVLALGALAFVPLFGFVVLFGYCQTVYTHVRAGETQLPSLSEADLGGGFRVLVGLVGCFLLPTLPLIVLAGVGLGIGEVAGSDAAQAAGLVMLALAYVVIIGLSMVSNILLPEALRRLLGGEWLPILSPMASWRAARDNSTPFIVLIAGGLIAMMLNFLGALACYVGLFLSLPLSYIITAHLAAQFDALETRA